MRVEKYFLQTFRYQKPIGNIISTKHVILQCSHSPLSDRLPPFAADGIHNSSKRFLPQRGSSNSDRRNGAGFTLYFGILSGDGSLRGVEHTQGETLGLTEVGTKSFASFAVLPFSAPGDFCGADPDVG